jgi:hypothetical protein
MRYLISARRLPPRAVLFSLKRFMITTTSSFLCTLEALVLLCWVVLRERCAPPDRVRVVAGLARVVTVVRPFGSGGLGEGGGEGFKLEYYNGLAKSRCCRY